MVAIAGGSEEHVCRVLATLYHPQLRREKWRKGLAAHPTQSVSFIWSTVVRQLRRGAGAPTVETKAGDRLLVISAVGVGALCRKLF
jgi:hypothetical protein